MRGGDRKGEEFNATRQAWESDRTTKLRLGRDLIVRTAKTEEHLLWLSIRLWKKRQVVERCWKTS